MEKTLSIVKPDAVSKNVIGKILDRFESAGLKIVAAKMIHLNDEKAKGFYAEHEGRPFFDALVEFMTSGPIVVQVLAGENAITKNRELMGDTNPETATLAQSDLILLKLLMQMLSMDQILQKVQLEK